MRRCVILISTFVFGRLTLLDEDADRTAPEVIPSRGFLPEIHNVTTPDGYIITVHRIVNPNAGENAPVVLLQHGMGCNSKIWMVNSPGGNILPGKPINFCTGHLDKVAFSNNVAFGLANYGFDVWLPNSRGSPDSQRHVQLSPRDRKFWEYSYQHMAEFDLPACIDYILNKTEQPELTYIGHSQGTIICFALLSSKPEYASKMNLVVLLAPGPNLVGARPYHGLVNMLPYSFSYLLKAMCGPSLPRGGQVTSILKYFCHGIGTLLCQELFFGFGGYNLPQTNLTRLHVYATTFFLQDSCMNFAHYGQMLKAQHVTLRKFDYRTAKENIDQYRQESAPFYEMGKITSEKMVLVRGLNDKVSTTQSVELLKKQLRVKLLADIIVKDNRSAHFDAVWAKDAYELIYEPVLEIMRKELCSG